MKNCWVPFNPDPSGNYLASPGGRYAVLLSVDSRASISDVTDELGKQNFQVTYSWVGGQPTRQPVPGSKVSFAIDMWLANLPKPTSGTVWMYFELTFTGNTPKALARHVEKCVLFICGSVDIAYAFAEHQVADDFYPCGPGDTTVPPNGGVSPCPPLPPPCPGPAPAPNPLKPALAGAAVGAAVVGVAWALTSRRRRSKRKSR